MTLFSAIRAVIAELTAPPDPARFAPDIVPEGWHVVVKKATPIRNPTTIYQTDETGRRFGFTDKPFEGDQIRETTLTDRDIHELQRRNLDAYNPAYAAAKEAFSRNPATTKGELHNLLPTIAKETAKDVLAAFRAAAKVG